MSTYELDDDTVRAALRTAEGLPRSLANALKEQLPQPIPQKIGAVVRTYAGAVFVRNYCGNEFVWCEVSKGAGFTDRWFTDVGLPRIVEVLSPGVDVP